jgi:rhodanese-related sulfurtransferase
MSALNAISPDKLLRLIGTPACPRLVDLRAGPKLIPSAVPMSAVDLRSDPQALARRPVVVICRGGHESSQGAAAWLRANGVAAEYLEGGFGDWQARGYPLVDAGKLPPRDAQGRTIWVTRARPKVDRIACPWLIRRFVDPGALFLFVAADEVEKVAAEYDGAAFDIEDAFWSHRGDLCTFDTMLAELGLLDVDALAQLAVIVRGADTARPDLVPQAAGLLAASLGLSRMYADDVALLDAGMILYDSLYRWCRDAIDETHDWTSHAPKRKQLA